MYKAQRVLSIIFSDLDSGVKPNEKTEDDVFVMTSIGLIKSRTPRDVATDSEQRETWSGKVDFLLSVIGVPALLVLIISNFPLAVLTSHAQPEPKVLMAVLVNCSWNAANVPKLFWIRVPSSPLGSFPPVGLRQCQ